MCECECDGITIDDLQDLRHELTDKIEDLQREVEILRDQLA